MGVEGTAGTAEGRRRGVVDGVLRVSRTLSVPLSEVEWKATPSGGPGGQHANRSSTRVEVSFDVRASSTLGPRQRARLLERAGPVVRASAAEERSQARNRQRALERLGERLHRALQVAPPRRPTRPTAGADQRRLAAKRRRSDQKRLRGSRPGPDD